MGASTMETAITLAGIAGSHLLLYGGAACILFHGENNELIMISCFDHVVEHWFYFSRLPDVQ